MSRALAATWPSDPAAYGPRRNRRACRYEAYVPDPLAGRAIALDGDVAADVVDAEVAIARLDVEASALIETEALAIAQERYGSRDIGGNYAGLARAMGGWSQRVTRPEEIEPALHAARAQRVRRERRDRALANVRDRGRRKLCHRRPRRNMEGGRHRRLLRRP